VRAPIWDHQPVDNKAADRLVSALGVEPIVARLLVLRGQLDPDQAQRFLEPSLDHLHDPYRLADMRPAVDRLLEAIARHERVAIHGDYDVDGIMSTVILRRALERLGSDVIEFVPNRLQEGYGLQPAVIEELHAKGVRLIVSVDCGIRGFEAARRARALGIDLVVTDHHEPDRELPPAFAVVNPKRNDCTYPDKDLAGVGVALKLVQALCERADRRQWLAAFVKVAAIGTLADVVPLVGENRVIVKLGLEGLSRGPNSVGVRALIEGAGLGGKKLDSFHVTFMIAPRVNAAGRMATPDIATRLMLASGEAMDAEARTLAERLNQENLKRQREEAGIVAQARRTIESDPDIGAHSLLIVGGDGWHRGVIGIVASKLVDAFWKPAIVLSIEGDVAYGSCRSIPAFDMLAALECVADLLVRFGGHRQAAGLTIETARIPEFRARLTARANDVIEPTDTMPRLCIDGPLPLSAITAGVVSGIAALEPFGPSNPRPVFYASPVDLTSRPRILKDRHLSMSLRQQGRVFRAIAWRAVDRARFLAEHRTGFDLAYSLDENHYQGRTYVQLTVADIKAAGT
jgi:single-stranded-DNA-specific exonuclease